MAGYQTYQSQHNNRDHILTNSFIDRNFKAAIFKSYISDHFPIYFIVHHQLNQKYKPKLALFLKRFSTFKQ